MNTDAGHGSGSPDNLGAFSTNIAGKCHMTLPINLLRTTGREWIFVRGALPMRTRRGLRTL